MAKISKETALAEITLRKYENPKGKEKRELIRKLCLSLGLLQPGDSRDVVVDVLQVVMEAKHPVISKEVEELVIKNRREYAQPMLGIAPSNIRRQLLRLRDLFILEKIANDYQIKEGSKLLNLFEENIEKYYLKSIISRVKEYLLEVDKQFRKE